MITAENNRKLPSSSMTRHDTSDSLADPGYESRIFHLTNWRVVLCRDLFELVVSIELNLPSQLLELLSEAGLNQVDGTVVNPELSLAVAGQKSGSVDPSYERKRTWPPLDGEERFD